MLQWYLKHGKWEGTGNHICLLSFFENQLSYKSGLRFYVELLPFKTGPILQKCKNFGWQEMAQPGAIHLFINIATFIGNLFSWIYCMSFDFICRILGTFRSNFKRYMQTKLKCLTYNLTHKKVQLFIEKHVTS